MSNKSAVQWLADKLRDEYGYDLTVHEHPRKLLEEALAMEWEQSSKTFECKMCEQELPLLYEGETNGYCYICE